MITEEQAVKGSEWLYVDGPFSCKVRITGERISHTEHWRGECINNGEWVPCTLPLYKLFPITCEDCGGRGTVERRLAGFDHGWREPCHCQEGKTK